MLTLTKRLEKKLDGNYTRMLRAILNKSWSATFPQDTNCTSPQLPPCHRLFDQDGRTRQCLDTAWIEAEIELIRDVLLWSSPKHSGRRYEKIAGDERGCDERTFTQLCEDTEMLSMKTYLEVDGTIGRSGESSRSGDYSEGDYQRDMMYDDT